jgi:predicted ATPase
VQAVTTEAYERGAYPGIVEKFEIINLHGYRTITLDSPFVATILIAQNGAGKTTLLNALDAFLKGQFLRLKDLQFSEIRCKLINGSEDLVVKQEDIQSLSDLPVNSEIATFSQKIQVEPNKVLNFIFNDFSILKEDIIRISDHPVYEATYRAFGYNQRTTLDNLEKIQSRALSYNANISKVITTVRVFLKDFEVIYLPTYRRIENPLELSDDNLHRRRRSKFIIPFSKLAGDMQFGLSDISERLADLNRDILFHSNRGYRKLSADIIKELLDGSFEEAEISDFYLPSSEDLNLFFSRLKKEGRWRTPFGEVDIPDINIDQLINPNSPVAETNRFLLYFISKLNSVIQATKDIEGQVENFIKKCNKYLSGIEEMQADSSSQEEYRQDSKALRLNREDLTVYAVSLPSERKIALDALSSGEKQMISLLAKLYLYPKQKIVLIDEPELSLSLDWQRQILEDVINAPTCKQLVAITHSPFVFDNSLEPFARSLNISINQDRIQSISSEENENEEEPH